MTESKTELLGWLNDLLQLNYTRIEQCGTGGAFCQIADSIYGNVPLIRVKFNSTTEYDWINNFKILQSVFNKQKIERSVPIDRLVKCRYSDNLEFLQWMKKYWDAFYPGGRYDALSKREAAIAQAKKPRTPRTGTAWSPTTPGGGFPKTPVSAVESGPGGGLGEVGMGVWRMWGVSAAGIPGSSPGLRPSLSQGKLVNANSAVVQHQERLIGDLSRQVHDLKTAANVLERERNFYYLKLRDLEVLVLEKLESNNQPDFLHEIQSILYATEEGFIRPNKNNPPKLAVAPIAVTVPRVNSASSRPPAPVIVSNTAPVTYIMTPHRPPSATSTTKPRRESSSKKPSTYNPPSPTRTPPPDSGRSTAKPSVVNRVLGETGRASPTRESVVGPVKQSVTRPGSANGGESVPWISAGAGVTRAGSLAGASAVGKKSSVVSVGTVRASVPALPKSGRGSVGVRESGVEKVGLEESVGGDVSASVEFGTSGGGAGE
ncbi:hypothetical protein BCR33DRAFT_719002 [Rhizoclosmatium globosum]|uniref:Uncharacterized protein n=1 Tax=Rhizoclosmatium globosum TaxID=329046 RepID=A0A1Y2C301_9FUNG|nr:hypothetical protein BCR33DRAFT_719002 [Rhizoclosmatium globosum]|eukprot:ORY41399.1 hypothetical protein BCR33DRAFT_719002 [Rhizoclosmatium globosum]